MKMCFCTIGTAQAAQGASMRSIGGEDHASIVMIVYVATEVPAHRKTRNYNPHSSASCNGCKCIMHVPLRATLLKQSYFEWLNTAEKLDTQQLACDRPIVATFTRSLGLQA